MSDYYFEFIARKVGAIGERGYYARKIKGAPDEVTAINALYEEFEHISIRHTSRDEKK